jgi:hypothetical protein
VGFLDFFRGLERFSGLLENFRDFIGIKNFIGIFRDVFRDVLDVLE